jgi:hypothetical protein
MSPNVTITPAAAKFINRIVRFSGLPAGAGLRLVGVADNAENSG